MQPKDVCPNCGCKFKNKYMVRVDYDSSTDGNCSKTHWELPTRNAIVGWVKMICNEFGSFEQMQIYNLTTECANHREFHKIDTEKQTWITPPFRKKKEQKEDLGFTIKQSVEDSIKIDKKVSK